MSSVRQMASEARRYVRQRLFGNNHSIPTNLRYADYERLARRKFKQSQAPTPDEIAAANEFAQQGYKVLPPPPAMTPEALDALRLKIDRLFEAQKGGARISEGMSRMIDGIENVPEIIDFIDPSLESTLEAYYKSHFKIFGIYFYRTVPTPKKPESSFLWHVDNAPRQEIKLMIYLDQVVRETGAIRLKTRPFSDDIRGRGFRDRKRYPQFSAELDDDKTTNAVEGGVGTRILFQNGQAVHRAVSPTREHRDVVTFVIIPSTIPWRPHFARNRHNLSTNAGICFDPFTDRPEDISYKA